MRATSPIAIVLLTVACGGVDYGYAREYRPLSDEQELAERAEQASYEEVSRAPDAYRDKLIGWFGVVQSVQPGKEAGTTRVSMQLRFHQKRHLCADQFESSCRVTVSEKDGGPFTAILTLHPEDREGQDRVYRGSLLKVYGATTGEFDEQGGPEIQTVFYRHWPRGKWVTTARQSVMLR